jgi:hypothetical protein
MMEARLGSNAMRHFFGGSRAAALIWIKPFRISISPAGRQDHRQRGRAVGRRRQELGAT